MLQQETSAGYLLQLQSCWVPAATLPDRLGRGLTLDRRHSPEPSADRSPWQRHQRSQARSSSSSRQCNLLCFCTNCSKRLLRLLERSGLLWHSEDRTGCCSHLHAHSRVQNQRNTALAAAAARQRWHTCMDLAQCCWRVARSALEQQVAESGAWKASGPGPLESLAAPTDAADTVPGAVGVHPATVPPY